MSPQVPLRQLRRVTVAHVVIAMLTVSLAAQAQDAPGAPQIVPPWLAEVVAVLGWPGVVGYMAWQLGRSVSRASRAAEAYAPACARMAAAAEEVAPSLRRALSDGATLRVTHDVVSGAITVNLHDADVSVSA